MTRFPIDNPRRRGQRPPEAAGESSAALVRLPLVSGPWTERVPAAPRGASVTVSLSSAAAAAEHGAALRFLGYRVVEPSGVVTATGEVADFLVPTEVAISHPTWWRALVGNAEGAYALAFGPVLAVLGDALRPHRATPRRDQH